MSMSDHIKQQVLEEFFAKKASFSRKTAILDFFVLPEWENQHTYLTYLESSQCGTEQPKEQPQICDRGSNPVAINQFLIFFSIGSTCSRALFHLLIFFILRVFAQLFFY